MRKDVKIGLAVGAVLLAVLITYVLVVPASNDNKHGAALTVSPPANTAMTSNTATSDATPATQPVVVAAAPSTAAPAMADSAAKPALATPAAASPGDARASGESTNWAKLLNTGMMPLMTETPAAAQPVAVPQPAASPTGSAKAAESAEGPTQLAAAGTSGALPASAEPASGAADSAASPTAAALPAGGRVHVVQAGETLSKIATAAYGNAKYYKQILAANPNVNELRLRPGMKLNLPEIDQAKVEQAAQPGAATVVGNGKVYKVQAGDSLQKIATKLYGSPKQWEAIYQLNESAIGADPAKVKLGMVLKLPDSLPTAAPAAAATH